MEVIGYGRVQGIEMGKMYSVNKKGRVKTGGVNCYLGLTEVDWASLTIHTSCIKQFWTTAKVKTINNEVRIQALIDEKRCLNAKTTSWNEFSSTMASSIICLATNQKFNFSRYILLSLVKNIEAEVPFFMFPRLPSPSNDPLPGNKDSMKLKELIDLCTHLSNKVLELESEVIDIKSTSKERIEKLEGRVDKLEEENMVLKKLYSDHSKVDTAAHAIENEKSFKQGRIISDIDEDDVNEKEPADVEEVLDVVKAAKLMTKVVTTDGATTTAEATKVSVLRRRRDVIIQDPKEITSTVVVHSKVQSKDKGKGILIEEPKPLKDQAQVEQDEAFARQLEAELNRKPLTEAQARKNMIIYLKNMTGFTMNYFKGMTYSEIIPFFEKHYNYNQAFLEKVNEEVTLPEKEDEVEGHKREGESFEKEITKKQKMDEEVEELRSHLQIVSNDDDVYTEATPLASKIPIIDYKIHFKRNKPYIKIIRADGNHMLFLSFSTLLKNFDREDLESLWKLVKESVWIDQKGRYGLAKRYPLTHFTLEQMLNNVRLEVEEESEMSLELLRLVRRQLNEGCVAE
nr:hypothetical protein [Tanacetum cinerariifolium]